VHLKKITLSLLTSFCIIEETITLTNFA